MRGFQFDERGGDFHDTRVEVQRRHRKAGGKRRPHARHDASFVVAQQVRRMPERFFGSLLDPVHQQRKFGFQSHDRLARHRSRCRSGEARGQTGWFTGVHSEQGEQTEDRLSSADRREFQPATDSSQLPGTRWT